MKKILKIPLMVIISTGLFGTPIAKAEEKSKEQQKVNYEEKLPYMFKEPNWEYYKQGDTGLWPLPKVPEYSSGIFSLANANSIDYKESSNNFFDTASKFKSSGNTEVYYSSNPSSTVTMALPEGVTVGKSIGGDATVEFTYADTNVPAYNNIKANNQLVLDSSQGQWLVTNGYFSRDNLGRGIYTTGGLVQTDKLDSSPWGLMGSSTFISPEDFLMGLSKSIYGVEESRSLYLQSKPMRMSKKITWFVVNPRHSDGSCGPIKWTYQTDNWSLKDASYINPAWSDTSPPACGTSKTIDRGEHLVHPEGYLTNTWYRHYNDQNSFVSANVYELYFSKLLQKGILTTDVAFANATPNSDFSPDNKNNVSSFSFNKSFADRFFREYIDYGKSSGGAYKYPSWAPELGALYSTPEIRHIPFGSNLTDREILITNGGGNNAYERALGINYKVSGNNSSGVTSIISNQSANKGIMSKMTVTLIDALGIIERAMRVEDGDMTVAEADIITKKYGAQYLDDLSESDRKTVSYLLAKGVLNFENYQEYSNLYSPLSKSFAYKLLYRVANEESRLRFTEITLTDSSDIPADFSEYKQYFTRANLTQLADTNSITNKGELVKNESREKLTLLADINFLEKGIKLEGTSDSVVSDRYQITASLDDPLKYLYRSMPLVNVNTDGTPIRTGDSLNVYVSNTKKIYNNVSEKEKRYVGIKSVTYNKITERYDVVFYAYGDSYQTALTFIKANLETRNSSVTTKDEEDGVINNNTGRPMSSQDNSSRNPDVKTNGDLIIDKTHGMSSYSGEDISIMGNYVTEGSSSTKMNDKTMTSTDVLAYMTETTAYEDIGNKQMVTVDNEQLTKNSIMVKNHKGKVVGRTTILQNTISSKPSTKGKGDIGLDFTGINVSLLKTADTLISEQKFTYTDGDKKERSLKGSVVMSWDLDLPTKQEQNSLVGNELTPYINDGSKASWIFTEPTNESLKVMWNYNKGIGDALIKTFGGSSSSVKMPSGYFTPKISILVDTLATETITTGNKRITSGIGSSELNQIERNIISKVSKNLPSEWVKQFVGNVALANYVIGDPINNKEDISKYIDKSKSTKSHYYVNPPGLFKPMLVPYGKTVWAYLAFNQPRPNDHSATYFNSHAHLPEIKTHTIYSTIDGNSYYGKFFEGEGEGIMPSLDITFAKDNYNNIYKNIETTGYNYLEDSNVIVENSKAYQMNKVGKTVKYKNEEFTIAGNNDYTIDLYSNKFILGVYREGKLYEATSGDLELKPVISSIHDKNVRTFGRGQEKGINSEQYMKTFAFNFIPDSSLIDTDVKFMVVKDSSLQPYVYKSVIKENGEASLKLEKTSLQDGDQVHVPSFVVLSKATWDIEGDNLKWSKSYLGASEELYTKGSLIQVLKEQILPPDSENIVLSQEVKTGTLDIGGATGVITNNNVTFKIPFSQNMISGSEINKQEVLDTFNRNADLTITDNFQTASATQYLKDKIVGAYDPYYKDYHNTLVDNKGQLQVATGTELVNYSHSSVVDSVSLTAIVMDGVKFLNNGLQDSDHSYKIYQYQTLKPPAVVSPFTNGAPPVLNADSTIIANTATKFESIPTALELFDSLKSHLNSIAVTSVWSLILLVIIGGSVTLSITTLLAHVFAHSPVSNVFFDKLFEVTGIDFLSIISVGTVRITGDFQNSWIRTLKTSIMLGVVPLGVFSVMVVYGLL